MNGEEMRYERKRVGLRGIEIAKELGVRAETVSRWERGKHPINSMAERLFLQLVSDNRKVAAIKADRRKIPKSRGYELVMNANPDKDHQVEVSGEAVQMESGRFNQDLDELPRESTNNESELPGEEEASGPEVEELRRMLREKFKVYGNRAVEDLATKSRVSNDALKSFTESDGELLESEFSAVLEVIQEAECLI
ncbi:MAG: helix-turn-helix transcriptional regulator [Syntrophaceae bacterium]|nr:helix-turn-helix transcriptional regulator [Syntrophaceae bacterium]